MRCLCLLEHGGPLTVVHRPMPQPMGDEVLVKVAATGLCHTDVHLWRGHYALGSGRRLDVKDHGIQTPLVLGHEIAGSVAAGPQELVGRHVLVHPWIGCTRCPACTGGAENLCDQPRFLGMHRPGGFSEYVLVPHQRYLVDITGLDPVQAAPLACAGLTAFSAIGKLGPAIHDGPVVVVGAGGLGLMAVRLLAMCGTRRVVAVDIDEAKLQVAGAAGAHAVVNAAAPDAVKRVRQAAGSAVHAVLELVGSASSVSLACAVAGRGAHVVMCGLQGGEMPLSLPLMPLKALTLQGSYVGTLAELRELVALVRRHGTAGLHITTRSWDEANEALTDLQVGRVVGRVVLTP